MEDGGTAAGGGGLMLDDLRVGQRFESGTHALDAEQILASHRHLPRRPVGVPDAALGH